MNLNWDLIKRFIDYYASSGGKVAEKVDIFRQARFATISEGANARIATERLYPLFERYLRSGITKKDHKEIKCLLEFLVNLTEKAPTDLDYRGSDQVKRYLFYGEDFEMMGNGYDNQWYLDSIDHVIEGIQVSIDYLKSILGDANLSDSMRSDVEQLIGKYTALHDKVESFRNATPGSQVTIAKALKPVFDAIIAEQKGNLRLKHFTPSLRATNEQNMFIKIEPNIKIGENAFNNPPRGAKIPSVADCTAAKIIPGRDIYKEIISLTNVRSLREQCLSLRDKIDADIMEKLRYSASLNDNVDEMQKELDDVVKKRQAVEMEKQQSWSQFQNGLLTQVQLTSIMNRLVVQIKDLDEKKARLDRRIAQRLSGGSLAAQQKRLYEMQSDMWIDIKSELNPILENPTESRNLIRFFPKINRALFTFGEYVNGFASSLQAGNNIDLESVREVLHKLVGAIKKQIDFAKNNTIEIDETIYGETTTETETQDNIPTMEELEKFFINTSSEYMPSGELSQSPTEAFRPNVNPNDPLAGIDNATDPTDDENPANNPLGIQKRNNNNNNN